MPTARPILEFIEQLTPDFLVAPVFAPIRALGIDLAHPFVLLIALGLLVCFWSWVLRTIWCVVGRRFGLYNPDQYHIFPRVPWRLPVRAFLYLRNFYRRFLMGRKQTAGWAGFLETLNMLYRPGKIMLGRFATVGFGWFMPVGIDPKKHLMMVAATGSGKTTSLATMLSLHRGNAFVVDPKPQLAPILARRCGNGGKGVFGKKRKVAVLDPKGRVEGHPGACWNPFDEIKSAVERRGEDAAVGVASKIAEALIKQDSKTQPFFANAAREFVRALVLHIHTTEPEASRNLVKLRKYLTVGHDAAPKREDGRQVSPRSWLLFKMIENKAYDGIIADAAAAFRDSSEGAQGNVMRTATVQTEWMDLPEIRSISQRSDFTLSELKTGTLTLFVCAPVSDVQKTLSEWFRLLTTLAIWVHEDILEKPSHPTLFIIDELPSLGYIEAIATTPAVMRSYGVRLVGITQTLEALRGTYPNHWKTMLSSASAVMWMGVEASEDLEFIRKRLGERTRWQKMKTPKGVDDRIERTERPLAYEQQIKDFLDPSPARSSNVLVDIAGKRFLRLKTPHYFQELPVYLYEPDPGEKESALRAWTRRFFTADHTGDGEDIGLGIRADRSNLYVHEKIIPLDRIWQVEVRAFGSTLSGPGAYALWFGSSVLVIIALAVIVSVIDATGLFSLLPEAVFGVLRSIVQFVVIFAPFLLFPAWSIFAAPCGLVIETRNKEHTEGQKVTPSKGFRLRFDDKDTVLKTALAIKGLALQRRRLKALESGLPMNRIGTKPTIYAPRTRISDLGPYRDFAPSDIPVSLRDDSAWTAYSGKIDQAKQERYATFGSDGRELTNFTQAQETMRTPAGTFITNGDGTVTHKEKGLMFVAAPWGTEFNGEKFTGEPVKITWDDATAMFGRGREVADPDRSVMDTSRLPLAAHDVGYRRGDVKVAFAEHDDWRLPTADELQLLSITDSGSPWQVKPRPGKEQVIDPYHARSRLFPFFSENSYTLIVWSATGANEQDAWAIDNSNWPVSKVRRSERFHVLFVRDTDRE